MFEKTWLEVRREDYVVDVSEEQDGSACLLQLAEGKSPFIVMGLPLFKGYYSIHDDTRGLLGFAPHKQSLKKGPFWGTVPTQVLGDAVD